MNQVDKITLKQCEAIINEGLNTLSKIDQALNIIKRFQLFEDEYQNFEDYCQSKWDINEKYNYIFIDSKLKLLQTNNYKRSDYESRQ